MIRSCSGSPTHLLQRCNSNKLFYCNMFPADTAPSLSGFISSFLTEPDCQPNLFPRDAPAAMLTYFFNNFCGITIIMIPSPFQLTFCVHIVDVTCVFWIPDPPGQTGSLSLCPALSPSTTSSSSAPVHYRCSRLTWREKSCPDCLDAARLVFPLTLQCCWEARTHTHIRHLMDCIVAETPKPHFTHQPHRGRVF